MQQWDILIQYAIFLNRYYYVYYNHQNQWEEDVFQYEEENEIEHTVQQSQQIPRPSNMINISDHKGIDIEDGEIIESDQLEFDFGLQDSQFTNQQLESDFSQNIHSNIPNMLSNTVMIDIGMLQVQKHCKRDMLHSISKENQITYQDLVTILNNIQR